MKRKKEKEFFKDETSNLGGFFVENARTTITLLFPYCNGLEEGQVNRLKTVKRMMYRHASVALLRKRKDNKITLINKLKKLSNVEHLGLLNASTNFSEGRKEEKGELDHIGVATTKERSR